MRESPRVTTASPVALPIALPIALAIASAVVLAVAGCESGEPPPEEHVFEGQVEAIDKAREVETILERRRERQD